MNRRLHFLMAAAVISAACTLAAAESAADFLNRARKWRTPAEQSIYAVLKGRIDHLRRGSEPESWPATFRIIINHDSSSGQLVAGTDEAYLLRHRRGEKYRNFATSVGKSTEKLSRAGVKASDLVLGFIFYDLEKELPEDSLGAGLIKCRVLQLKSQENRETVKVWFMKQEAIPLRAEFYNSGSGAPYRSIEIVRGDKFDGVYCATRIRVSGPGWRTIVDFDKAKSSCGILKSDAQTIILPLDRIYEEHRKQQDQQ